MKKDLMLQALELSKNALPACLPNPPVACLLVENDSVVAKGFTQEIGGNHAEIEALNAYNGDCSTLSAYVTLEPCSFAGRTGACAQALIDSVIKHIVVAMLDPDPRNDGRGVAMLQAAGVVVELGCCELEVQRFLEPYLGLS